MVTASGRPKTGGRQKGTPNKRTAATLEAIAASGMTPLEYLIAVMRDEANDQATRIDAAKAAAPYCHAKLASIEHSGPDGSALVVKIVRFSEAAIEE